MRNTENPALWVDHCGSITGLGCSSIHDITRKDPGMPGRKSRSSLLINSYIRDT